MAQSVTGICNRALQLVGSAQQILNLTDTTREARALNRAYDPCRLAELRAHVWNFAKRRAQLAADTTAPLFGPTHVFPLPVDCLRVLVDPNSCDDWAVEGRAIVASSDAPLNLQYVADITDPTQFDALFCEALSARIAVAIVEDITQSNTKQQAVKQTYSAMVAEARQADAIEKKAQTSQDSSWITARRLDSSAIWGQR